MTARRGPRLANLRAQGTSLGALDLPDEFRTWLLERKLVTAEAVYGFFYSSTPDKDAVLKSFDWNYQRLYDRLGKVIPPEKIRQLNALAEQQYELGEA